MSLLVPKEWNIITAPPSPLSIGSVIQNYHLRTRWKLHPRHQRYDYTWSDEDRQLYIDSIEKDFAHTGTIILSAHRDEDGYEEIYILDGGHRVHAILRFCGVLGTEYQFRDMYDRLYSDLDDCQKMQFDSKHVTIVKYTNLTPEQEDIIFMRINRNLALSQGETINAMKSTPICNVTHELSEMYKDVMCANKTGLANCGDGSRMEEKAYMFVLCVNFLMKKVVMYEKPGTKVLTIVERYKNIPMPSLTEMDSLKNNMKTLFSLIDVERKHKFKFYNLIVGQWLILNSPELILRYKRFMESVHMKDSIWAVPWKDAVKDDEDSNQSRVNGIDVKNLNSRVNFFKKHFVKD